MLTKPPFTIQPIKALNDNYIWAIVNNDNKQVVIIDPSTDHDVIDFLDKYNLTLSEIWTTHKHYDHTDGVNPLKQRYPNISVTSHSQHPVNYCRTVSEGSEFELWGYTVTVLRIAGHSENHLAYIIEDDNLNKKHVFCGDILFSGGCGRVFTGDMQSIADGLHRINTLADSHYSADNIILYPAHEYTASNLRFGLSIEPNNQAIAEHLHKVIALNEQGKPSLPTTLALEQQINVFLHLTQQTVIDGIEQHTPLQDHQLVTVFTALRRLKDRF